MKRTLTKFALLTMMFLGLPMLGVILANKDIAPYWEYFWYATLPLSTVLPAVMGTRDWLLSCLWPEGKWNYYSLAK